MNQKSEVEIVDQNEGYAQEIRVRDHVLWADEPVELDGLDSGPTPYELLLAAVGGCTSITIRMYARRKGWPLESLRVQMFHEKVPASTGKPGELVDRIEKRVELVGPLTEDQRKRLLEIADRCPVHRTIHSEILTETIEISSGI